MSWDKVHAVTESLIKKKLAFVKDRVVLSAPSVYESLVEQAQVTGDFTKADIDQFIQVLTPTNPPPTDRREAAHIEWLEKRLQKYPDDLQSLTRLAWRYYEKKETDCKKTSKIYEQLIMRDPSRSIEQNLQLLHGCYSASGNYDEAIKVYYSIIAEKKMEPFQEVYIRIALADAFDNKGKKEQALQELEKASSVVKEMTFSYPWLENSAHKTEIEEQISESKTQLLKLIDAAKEKVESKK
ncbi:MAG: hypothetical protein HY753_03720 [Nitrospirae bacterium]|nr:hypothetical protein [Nitrospirota bacterium]